MAGGTPRTVSFDRDEMIALGEEMVKWVINKTPLHLSEWYTTEKMYTYNQWKTFIKRPEFIPYYEKALKIVGKQYLDKTSNVREGVSQRWQRVYFCDLKEEEDETTLFNAQAGAIKSDIPPNDIISEKDRQIMVLEYELKKLRDAHKPKTE